MFEQHSFNELSEHAAFIKVTVGDSRAASYLRRHFALSHLIPQPPALPATIRS